MLAEQLDRALQQSVEGGGPIFFGKQLYSRRKLLIEADFSSTGSDGSLKLLNR